MGVEVVPRSSELELLLDKVGVGADSVGVVVYGIKDDVVCAVSIELEDASAEDMVKLNSCAKTFASSNAKVASEIRRIVSLCFVALR